MKFADIPGHDDLKRRLTAMVDEGHMPHALLLEGPAGAAKFSLARALARYIHCENRIIGHDSCGTCPACRQHDTFNHIDTILSFPVVKKNSRPTISDDYLPAFREFISEHPFMDFDLWLETLDNINAQPQIYVEEGNELLRRLNYMTRRSAYKVILLWLPERLKEETANKLLKLVEEPFADTIFIMVSNNSRAILPTIYSRTQRIAVRRYDDTEITAILSGHGIEPASAASLATLAEGNVNTALRLAGIAGDRLVSLDRFASLMRLAYSRKVAELRQWSIDIAALGREPAMQFLDYSARMLRENFLLHLSDERLITLDPEERKFCSRFFPFVNERNVLDLFEAFNESRRDIAGNANARIVLFDMAVKIIMYLRR